MERYAAKKKREKKKRKEKREKIEIENERAKVLHAKLEGICSILYCQQHILTLCTYNILLLSNFYRNIIYVSIYKTAISLSHYLSISLSLSLRRSDQAETARL